MDQDHIVRNLLQWKRSNRYGRTGRNVKTVQKADIRDRKRKETLYAERYSEDLNLHPGDGEQELLSVDAENFIIKVLHMGKQARQQHERIR